MNLQDINEYLGKQEYKNVLPKVNRKPVQSVLVKRSADGWELITTTGTVRFTHDVQALPAIVNYCKSHGFDKYTFQHIRKNGTVKWEHTFGV